jgi:hypothetical protein
MNPEDEAEEDGANVDLDSQRKGKCVVLKTSTRQVSSSSYKYLLFKKNYCQVPKRLVSINYVMDINSEKFSDTGKTYFICRCLLTEMLLIGLYLTMKYYI